MEKRALGNSGLFVSPLCFGGNVFGWTIGEEMSFKLLDAFTARGFNFIDTADVYSVWAPGNQGGESETVIGKWLQKSSRRSQVIIATKSGFEMAPGKKGLSHKHIIASADASLRRLQTDYIDLYQSHTDDETVPQEETLEAYQQLIREGKVRAIGASNFTAARLKSSIEMAKLHGLPGYQSLQPEYNIYDRAGYEKELEPLCRSENIGVISYYSLAQGFLTGKYRTEDDLAKSTRGESVKCEYFNERGWRILKALDEVSAELKTTPARLSLAWLMARPGITAPIASATKLEQLEEMMAAAELKLTPATIEKMNAASAY